MTFDRPDMLLWLLVLIPVGLLIAWGARRRRQVLAAWGEGARAVARVNARRRTGRNLVWAGAVLGIIFGLAEPRGASTSRLLHRQGSDIVFVLDLSKSMLAEDVAPNRLGRAIFEIEKLIERFRADRVALVVFAGTAFMQAPLTVDSSVVRNMMHNLSPLAMPYPGSNIAGGIDRGLELLKASPSGGRALVLFTDGEETTGHAVEAARRAGADGVPVHVLAIGTARGEPIPVGAENGGLLRGPDGKPVFSKLDEDGLRAIADQSGGRYFRLGAGGDADAVGTVVAQLDKKTLEERTVTERAELYTLAVVPAFFLLAVGLWLGLRSS